MRHRWEEDVLGKNYEEKDASFLAVRGQMTRSSAGVRQLWLRTFRELTSWKFVTDDWNSVHLIVRGNVATTSSTVT